MISLSYPIASAESLISFSYLQQILASNVWDRQMRWNLKRDIYVRLLEALGDQLDVESHGKLLEQIRRREPDNAFSPPISGGGRHFIYRRFTEQIDN